MHGADFLGEHPVGQNPLFPPVHGCLVGIFSADAVLSTSARRQISLHTTAAPPVRPQIPQEGFYSLCQICHFLHSFHSTGERVQLHEEVL